MTSYKKPFSFSSASPFVFIFLFSLLTSLKVVSQNCAVNAGIDQTICVTQPLVLTGVPGSPQFVPPSYQWTKISGPSATITSPSATTTTVTGFTPGNYVFEFSAKCVDGLWARNLVSITVLPEPAAALAGADVTICTNTPVSLSANTPPSGLTGAWTVSPAGGTFSPNANTPNATYTPTATSGIRTLTWTISNGSCSVADNMLVNVVATPAVNAGPDQTRICQGSSTTLAASSPGLAPPQSGLWTVVSGPNTPVFSNINSNTSTLSNLVPGTYTLRWTVSGPCVSGSDLVVINVTNITVAPNAGSNTTYTTFCSSPAVTAQVLTGAALAAGETALWAQTSGGTAPYPNVTFLPDNTGATVTVDNLTGTFPYVFTYTKTGASGCAVSRTHTIYRAPVVQDLSEPANMELPCNDTFAVFNVTFTEVANITSSITARNGVRISGPAATGTLAYDNTTTASGGIRTEKWRVSGMITPGTYIYRMEYRNACGSVFRDVAVTISKTPGSINAGSDIVLPCNTLSATPIGITTAPGTFNWIQMGGPNIATVANPTTTSPNMTGLTQGVYQMRFVLSGGKNCPSKTDDMLVYVTTAVPTVATTGSNATICSGSYRLSANTPLPTETGTWTVTPSTGISFLPNANTPNAVATGLANNTSYSFTWTVSNNCGSINSSQTLLTTSTPSPPMPAAGADVCLAAGTTSVVLSGNNAAGADILWTALSVGASVASASSQSTTANITGGSGTYLFEYSLSTTGCSTLRDTVVVTVNSLPVIANAGTDQDICVPTLPATVSLSATPSAPAGSISLWSQVSGPSAASFVSAGNVATDVNNLQAGIYEFQYSIISGVCTSASDIVSVRIGQQPSPAVAGPDQSICNATTSTNVTLAATAPAVGGGYWQVVSGPVGTGTPTFSNSTSPTSNINGLSQGVYTLRWTVVNGVACAANTDDVEISISTNAAAGADINGCSIPSINLTGSANTSGTWTQISGPAGATLTSNSPNTAIVTGLTATSPSSVYTFRYSLPAVGACAATTDDMIFTNYPSPGIADAGADQELCFNANSITISGIAPTEGSGSWIRESGPNTPAAGSSNSTKNDTTLNNIVAGLYVYRYDVTTNASCVASSDRMQILKEVTANAGADINVCNVTTVNLAGNAPVLNQGTWALVSGPNTPVFTNVNNPATSVSGMIPGTYIFSWTVTGPGGCTANTDQVQVVIDAPVSSVDAGTDQSFCEGAELPFQIGATAIGGASYTWTPAVLLSNASIAQPTFTGVSNAGIYTYTVRAVNGACEATDVITITVKPKPNVSINSLMGGCGATFTASDIGSGVSNPIVYSWTFGTALTANPVTASSAGPHSVTYLANGTKTTDLTITSGDGCSNSGSVIVAPSCTLPVTLTSFEADWKNSYTVVKWTFENATDLKQFELEKSYDGRHFEKCQTITYHYGQTNFSCQDYKVNNSKSTVYYRLKMVDLNGAYTYSEIRSVAIAQRLGISVLPNPFREKIGLSVAAKPYNRKVTLTLISNPGREVVKKEITVNNAVNYIELTGLSYLPAGIYFLVYKSDTETYQLKLVKE